MLPACQPQYNGPGWSAPCLVHCGIGEVFELFRFYAVCQWPSISITNVYTNIMPVFGYSLFIMICISHHLMKHTTYNTQVNQITRVDYPLFNNSTTNQQKTNKNESTINSTTLITQRRAAVTNPLSPARRTHHVVLTSGYEQRVLGGAPPPSHPPACTGGVNKLDKLRQMRQLLQPIFYQAGYYNGRL